MELESRKDESKSELKRQDIAIEVCVGALLGVTLPDRLSCRSCLAKSLSASVICVQTLRRLNGRVCKGQLVSSILYTLVQLTSTVVTLFAFIMVIIVGMEISPKPVPSPPSRPPPPQFEAERTEMAT